MVRQRLSRLFEEAEAAWGLPAGGLPAADGDPTRATGGYDASDRGADQPGFSAPHDQATAEDVPTDGSSEPLSEPSPESSPVPSEASLLSGPGAFDPGRRGVKALAVVAAVVVLVAAGWAWRSRPRSEPVATASAAAVAGEAGEQADGSPADGQPAGAGSAAAGGQAEVVVAVAGKVRRPGLVRLPAGARVADALEAAGGPQPGTDVALLNLARKVVDGELILVGVTAPPGAAGAPPGGAVPGAPAGPGGGKVSLNNATLAELDALPGVGPVLAQRIIDHREQHGGFRSVSDLRQVTGIGDARYEDLKSLVTL